MPIATIRRTPATPALDATDLIWLLEQFAIDRRTKLDNQKTVDNYECRLRLFVAWWHERGPTQGWLLQASDLVAFERHLRLAVSTLTERPLSWGYRSGILYTLKEALHWACAGGYTEHNYAAWVPNAHGAAPKRKAASCAALLRLLEEAGRSRHATRDRAMIAMLLGMGLRRGEVSNLNIEEIHFCADSSGHAHVYGKRTKANPDGSRDAAFDSATGKIIAEHIAAKRHRTGPLLRNKFDARLSPAGVHNAVKDIIHRAKLWDEIIGCHDLRRGFTTYYARAKKGSDSADLRRRQLGHAQYRQTTDYTLYDIDDIRADIISIVSLAQGAPDST